MRSLRESDGPNRVKRCLRRLNARMESNDLTLPMAPTVALMVGELRDAIEGWEIAEDRVIACGGAIVFADEREDRAIGGFARRAKAELPGGEQSVAYKEIFVEAPSHTTRGVATLDQSSLSRHIADIVARDPRYVALRPYVPPIVEARASVELWQSRHAEAAAKAKTAWSHLQAVEARGRAIYNGAYTQLMAVFNDDKRLVETFFVEDRKSTAGPEGTPGAAPEGTTGG